MFVIFVIQIVSLSFLIWVCSL